MKIEVLASNKHFVQNKGVLKAPPFHIAHANSSVISCSTTEGLKLNILISTILQKRSEMLLRSQNLIVNYLL